MKTEVQHEVGLARSYSQMAVRYVKAGYTEQARRSRGMMRHHMAEARLAKRRAA